MGKFIRELFSNRFGIVLAALNLCYFVGKIDYFTQPPFGKLFVKLHSPAVASTIFSLEFVKLFAHQISPQTEVGLANLFFGVFIVLQWLFIAWIAKTLARKFRR